MTPNEMRAKKVQDITEAAQGLGWEAEVEIDGFSFTALLSAEGASGQIVEGKLGKALKLIDDFGGPELYSLVEEYDLVPLGVKDEAAELDEFVTEHDAGEEETNDEENEERDFGDPEKEWDRAAEEREFEESTEFPDAADAMCADCNGEKCGIPPAWVTELAASVPEPVEGEGWEVKVNGLHEDPFFGDGRYTSPKETWAAAQISDTPQNEYEHQHGGPALAQEVTVSEKTEGYVKTASRIVANEGFVVVARPKPTDQAEGFKVQYFASINLSHAAALRDRYGYSIGIAPL